MRHRKQTQIFARFEEPDQMREAIRQLRSQGHRQLDVYMPYWVKGVDEDAELPPSRLPWFIAAMGAAGALAGYGLQWLVNAYLYPLNVGGRPPHFPLSFVPITFEMGILAASITAFFGVLALGRMWRLWDPVFEIPGFNSASEGDFWIALSLPGRDADTSEGERALRAAGAVQLEVKALP